MRFSVVLAALAGCHQMGSFDEKIADAAEEALDSDPVVDSGDDTVPVCQRWGIKVASSLATGIEHTAFVGVDPSGVYRFASSQLSGGLGWRSVLSRDRLWFQWEMLDPTFGEQAQKWLFYYAALGDMGTTLDPTTIFVAGDVGLVGDDQLDLIPFMYAAFIFADPSQEHIVAVIRPECLDDGADGFVRDIVLDTTTFLP